jgi:hypothetical protein
MMFIQMLQQLRITLKIYKKMINIIQLKNNGN